MRRKALITCVTGQDGSYLAEFLLEKEYGVYGINRRASAFNTDRIHHLNEDPQVAQCSFLLHHGDLMDSSNLTRMLHEAQPDEVYNLGAHSHVAVSFESPEYTADVRGVGTLRLLEAIRRLGLVKKTRFYQASSSELFGLVQVVPQPETTPFYPRSPYGVAKRYAFWITVNYRESYGMYARNGILFNYESSRRGATFVTLTITRELTNVAQGLEQRLFLGNLNALRDWGHAKDHLRMQWLMLQQDQPQDLVIARGVQVSVREFVEKSATRVGIALTCRGSDELEEGVMAAMEREGASALKPDIVIVKVDPRYFRPVEVVSLRGDRVRRRPFSAGFRKSRSIMIDEMVAHGLDRARRHALLLQHGYSVATTREQ